MVERNGLAAAGPAVVTAADVVAGHVTLDVSCLDRVYLNGYVAKLQTPGGVVYFFHDHRGKPIVSPALFEPIGEKFRKDIRDWAQANGIPVIRFTAGERKADVMAPYLEAAAAAGRSQVVAVGCAQEFQLVWTARKRDTDPGGCPQFSFTKEQRRVSVFYVYIFDERMGPGFIKICTYFPYPVKVWVNGHEWAKRQALAAGIGFTALSNGFASCDDPAALQAICDRFGPGTVQVWFERWMARLPLPLTERRPGRRVLVGAVDAAGRDLPHPGLRRRLSTPARSSRRCCARTWTWAARRTSSCCSAAASGLGRAKRLPARRRVQDQDRPVLRPGHPQRVLQELPAEAVPEGRRRAAHRNRRQRPQDLRCNRQLQQPARAAGQGACDQRPPAGN